RYAVAKLFSMGGFFRSRLKGRKRVLPFSSLVVMEIVVLSTAKWTTQAFRKGSLALRSLRYCCSACCHVCPENSFFTSIVRRGRPLIRITRSIESFGLSARK